MSKNTGVLAYTIDGKITTCKAPEDKRGFGRCNHVFHQNPGESDEDFMIRAANYNFEKNEEVEENDEPITLNNINQEEILEGRKKLYELLGTEEVTQENLMDIINNLPPEKQNEVFKLGFQYAPYFAFPINLEQEDEKEAQVKIQLSNMGNFGLGAKQKHIDAILNQVGEYVTKNGTVFIEGNYKDGLNEDEWWSMMFATRRASVNKTVSISKPGAEARYLFYGLSDTYIMEGECNNPNSEGIIGCTAPGGFCEKCARKSGMGKVLDQLKKEQKGKGIGTIKIGGLVSTNLSEPLTQLYLDAIHNSSSDNAHTNIVNTFECYSSSPIVKKVAALKTTKERREALYNGLKNLYKSNDVKIDDYNLQIISKKMTSYKRTPNGIKLINEDKGELCDLISIRNIGGNTSQNVFKNATFSSAFETISKGGKMSINEADSFNDIFREEI